uniref:WH2 domain-containing protein n=1 Tax=Timema douglasi TaxID=61478 RepID=A0A7R8VBM3_TIMDO|nr:unnamed protein product [Timema douglasi]
MTGIESGTLSSAGKLATGGAKARLWVQVIHELRHGVKLKKVDFLHSPGRTPIEYELTPYEILMDDIRSRRYKLNKVTVDGSIPHRVKKDAHAVILEFIRSRPPLRKASERKMPPPRHRPRTPREQLMDSIKQGRRLRPSFSPLKKRVMSVVCWGKKEQMATLTNQRCKVCPRDKEKFTTRKPERITTLIPNSSHAVTSKIIFIVVVWCRDLATHSVDYFKVIARALPFHWTLRSQCLSSVPVLFRRDKSLRARALERINYSKIPVISL